MFGDKAVKERMTAPRRFRPAAADIINAYAYGDVWSRPGLDPKIRSLVVLAMMAAINRPAEFSVHVRGALANGATPDEIREVLLMLTMYCGIPPPTTPTASRRRLLIPDNVRNDYVLNTDLRPVPRRHRRASAELSDQADPPGGAVPARRLERSRGAQHLAEARRAPRAADHRRLQGRRGRQRRRGGSGEAAPDGHTVLIVWDTHATNHHLYKVQYDFEKSLVPVTLLVQAPVMMVATAGFPASTVKE